MDKQTFQTKVQRFSTQIQSYRVEFTFNHEQLNIKIISEAKLTIFFASLTQELLNELDPSIMLTFVTLECMYREMVEIAKSKEDIQIGQDGIIKLRINIALKSGVQHKDLVFETETRSMTDYDILEMRLRHQNERSHQEKEELLEKIRNLQKELDKAQKERGKLVEKIEAQKEEFEVEIEELNKKIGKERQHNFLIFQEMKLQIKQLKEELFHLKYDMSLLINKTTKIKLKVNKFSKCFTTNQKVNYFQYSSKFIEKKGQTWTQLLFTEKLSSKDSNFYELYVTNTKNHYICLGFGNKNCLDQIDSKWSKHAVTLFLLDTSILCEGKSVRDPQAGLKVGKDDKIRVRLQPEEREVSWSVNNTQVIKVRVSSQFLGEELYPLIICHDDGDRIQF